MRWEVRPVADLTADEQSALRTLSLAVYPPETAAAWPGRAIEWAPHQWGVICWDDKGAALCYVGVVLREARWDDRAVKVGGIVMESVSNLGLLARSPSSVAAAVDCQSTPENL